MKSLEGVFIILNSVDSFSVLQMRRQRQRLEIKAMLGPLFLQSSGNLP